MRILHAAPCVAARSGGPAVAVEVTTAMLGRAGHTVVVVATDQLMEPEERTQRAGEYLLFRSIGGTRVAFSPSMLWWMLRHVRGFDVVHVHGYQQPVSLGSIAACVLARVPFVLSPHGTLGTYELAKGRRAKVVAVVLVRALLAMAPPMRILCTTVAEARDLPDWASPSAVSPIPVEPVSVPQTRPGTGAPPRPFVLHLGRVAAKKGLERIAGLLSTTAPELDLVVAGNVSTPEAEGICAKVSSLLGERARFVGHVSGDEKASLLRSASCLALLSDDENFAVAVAEALVVGTPVLISERVGLSALVTAIDGGVVVPADGAGVTSTDLARVLDRRDRRRLADAARSHFDPTCVATGLETIYRELADGRA